MNHAQTNDFLIHAEKIRHRYGKNSPWVLNNISLTIHPREIITLIGPNGAGKSTLLSILLGLTQPSEGKLQRQKDLKIGFMPQKIQVDPTLPLTVERFLQLGEAQTKKNLFSNFFNKASSSKKLKRPIEDLCWAQIIEQLNISKLLNKPVQKVSGGEMQRILLARALLRQPDLLVLDEPVQGVDLQGQAELYQYIQELRNQYNISILMVSHDLHLVMNHTDQVICLNQHICCSGHPYNVSQAPEFKHLFGDFSGAIAIYEHHHSDSCDHSNGHIQMPHSFNKLAPKKLLKLPAGKVSGFQFIAKPSAKKDL
ncbi:ATP-binding cassette domain-containing protein [Thiomicrorhabdus indica]|uniref:ATP-binding cassette domain-containing protein n=1 Tax=Thiomicrorhabdus indica TaxID=2267253 RepID=UPI002AA6BBD4|nr:ATP-binding cassette domain-containing protein [Thiomicrorhabdus indica]